MSKKKEPRAFELDRRQFIVVSGAAMTGIAVSALADSAAPLIGSSVPPLLSVGYWPGTSRSSSQVVGADLRVVVARDVNSDPSLIQRGAKITVDGLWRTGRSGAVSIALLANFRTSESADAVKTPFVAWSYVDDTHVTKISNRVKFEAPVDATDGIELTIARSPLSARRRGARAAVPVQPTDSAAELVRLPNEVVSSFSLAVNGSGKEPKLAPGTYFIALRRDSMQAEPSWSSMHVFAADSGSRLSWLRGDGILSPLTPDFDYLVLIIEPAKPLETE